MKFSNKEERRLFTVLTEAIENEEHEATMLTYMYHFNGKTAPRVLNYLTNTFRKCGNTKS